MLTAAAPSMDQSPFFRRILHDRSKRKKKMDMKILFINSVYNWGSTGKIVRLLFTACEADGCEPAVCYGRTMTAARPEAEKNVYKFGLDWETRLHALLTRLTGRTGCFSHFSTLRLLKFMDEFQPDIVNLHEPHAYFLDLKPFFEYIKEHNIPLVYTFHCEFAFTGKCGHPLECENWKHGCGKCPHLKDYPKTLFFDRTASMLAEKNDLLHGQNMTLVCPSQWLADRTKQSILKDCDVRVIPNGIDTAVFKPQPAEELRRKLGIGNEKIVLAVAPDLSMEHKGIDKVLELAERMKGDAVRFVLVGKISDSMRFPENVTAVGRTENRLELAKYYSLADCFVICSDMENLPTTCIEAVCCGTPVAGFDVGGTKETAPEPLGRFCKYGDLDALENNVRFFLAHKPDAALFDAAREKYSLDEMYRRYRKIYDEMLRHGKGE